DQAGEREDDDGADGRHDDVADEPAPVEAEEREHDEADDRSGDPQQGVDPESEAVAARDHAGEPPGDRADEETDDECQQQHRAGDSGRTHPEPPIPCVAGAAPPTAWINAAGGGGFPALRGSTGFGAIWLKFRRLPPVSQEPLASANEPDNREISSCPHRTTAAR